MPLPIPAPREEGFTRDLYWAAFGPRGASRLLVLHGGPGADQRYLQPQMLHLAERHDTIFYDQRGGGKSTGKPGQVITWKTQVDDLAAMVGAFGLEPASIVGFSWGALLALLAAGTGAIRPRRLVLIDPAPTTRQYRAQFEANMAARQAAVAPEREALRASGLAGRDPDAYRQRAFELSVAGYFADPSRAHDLTPFRVMGRVQQSVWESLADYDVRRNLAGIRVSALVLHGRQDPVPLQSSEDVARALGASYAMPSAAASSTAERVPTDQSSSAKRLASTRRGAALGAELVVIDDCGHVPYVEQPEKTFAAIDRFLDATEATS